MALRIANCSGFFGDRRRAAAEMVEGGPIDILTDDYLAELTMAILARHRMKESGSGYVPRFLDHLQDVLVSCIDRGIRVVTNAGGLDPTGLGAAVSAMADRLGVNVRVATVSGDDMLAVAAQLRHAVTGEVMADRGLTPLTANAYLGGWGIAAALDAGADIVVAGRVADASLVVGPAAWRFGWDRDDWDRLAGAVVAGHIIECGAQATGGNFSFFTEVPDLPRAGFPIAEIDEDGSSVITKHSGTGEMVTTETVTAQLLYEVGGPRYLNPDVVARLDSVVLSQSGSDRVTVSGVVGEPAPITTKVAATAIGGFRIEVTFVLPGLDVEAKAAVALEALWARVGPPETFAEVEVRLSRTDHPDPGSHEASFATLKVSVSDPEAARVGRRFSNAAVELALATYPAFLLTEPPGGESPQVVYWPSVAPQPITVVTVDGASIGVPPTDPGEPWPDSELETSPTKPPSGDESTVRTPIGRAVGARSGDKGGDADVGVWARSDAGFVWMERFLTVERLRVLIPETSVLEVHRFVFPRLRAMNFVLVGYLGEGAASSTRSDPQAKALGEYLRARLVDVPRSW
ncbi:MAG: DUF1446 domain-containing protein [Acidimicrobiia bacterium]|nr:DUF1446 domain-containing protein [Acidimicrobiia bacterium]